METVDITYLGSNDQYQQYNNSDLALVNKSFITPSFGGPTDYIEFFIKDLAGSVIGSNYNVTDYNIGSNVNPKNSTTSELRVVFQHIIFNGLKIYFSFSRAFSKFRFRVCQNEYTK